MKIPSCFQTILTATFVAASIVIETSAQSQNQNSEKAPERRQFGMGAAGRFSAGFERVLSVLTEEQRASMREAMAADREQVRDLDLRIRQARREMFELGLKEKFDEAAVREKATAAAKLDAEMTVLRVKALSRMRPPLTAEQIAKIRESARSELGESQAEAPRRRHDIPRDENGLPLKEQTEKKGSGEK
jgi:Spy/CpxP family protein refolding chaperone